MFVKSEQIRLDIPADAGGMRDITQGPRRDGQRTFRSFGVGGVRRGTDVGHQIDIGGDAQTLMLPAGISPLIVPRV